MGVNLLGRSFLKLLDFSSAEIRYLLDLSKELKKIEDDTYPARSLKRKKTSYYCLKKPQHAHAVLLKLPQWI